MIGGNRSRTLLLPSRLTKVETANELPGSWSPDGNWFAYAAERAGKVDLMKVKTTGQATPIVVKTDVGDAEACTAWSPDGNWIAYWVGAEGGTWVFPYVKPSSFPPTEGRHGGLQLT